MVGIPGRSRGCLTCRSRRKGCDRQRPICGQCRSASIVCKGYDNNVRVVHYNPTGYGSTRYIFDQTTSLTAPSSLPSIAHHGMLERAVVEDHLVDAYCYRSFPGPNGDGLSSLGHNRPLSAMYEISSKWRDDRLIAVGLRALVCAALGRQNDDQRLSTAGLQSYSRALSSINKSLQSPQLSKSNSVLAACKVLALYELEAGSGFNWERHVLGINRLIYFRGPSKHVDDFAHWMFLDARYHGILAALKRREDTFLSKPEWKQIPWTGREKDIRQELLDIVADLPSLFAEYDRINELSKFSQDVTTRSKKFFARCQNLRQGAGIWYGKFREKLRPDVWSQIENGISPSFSLAHFHIAHTLTHYWKLCLLLYSTVKLARRNFPPGTCFISVQELQSYDPEPHAVRIASSTRYFFQPGAGSIGPPLFAAPMGSALQYFAYAYSSAPLEHQQLVEGFSSSKMGPYLAKFLTTFQASSDPWKKADCEEDPADNYEAQRFRATKWYEEGRQPTVEHETPAQYLSAIAVDASASARLTSQCE